MSTMTADNVKSILKIVQEKLEQRAQKSGIALKVSPEASRQEDQWLYVVVSPGRAGIRAYDFVSTLSDVERELKNEGIEHVLVLPMLAE
ncbi:MAG TPA: hypothetical protein VHY37_08470 [Tepidisphaeraceae bacterium]|nr:hypothetical protein [Tepidisphaeraceae bacterium]